MHHVKKDQPVRLSYSAVSLFQECRRKYYYTYVRHLELKRIHMPYVMGNTIHTGIFHILSHVKDYVEKSLAFFDAEVKLARKGLSVNIQKEQELIESRSVIPAMLQSYSVVHKKFISEVEVIHNEKSFAQPINDKYTITGRSDNMIKRKKDLYFHEIKSTKSITPDYVQSIQNSMQTVGYFHAYNMTNKPPAKGVIFDLIKKPSIRQKKKEGYKQFLKRLVDLYTTKKSKSFYMETIEKPLISSKNLFNIYSHTAKEMDNCKTVEDYYHNYKACNSFGRCEFYNLCFYGENSLNLANYKQKEYRNETINKKD